MIVLGEICQLKICKYENVALKFPIFISGEKEDIAMFVGSFKQVIVYLGLTVVGIHELRPG